MQHHGAQRTMTAWLINDQQKNHFQPSYMFQDAITQSWLKLFWYSTTMESPGSPSFSKIVYDIYSYFFFSNFVTIRRRTCKWTLLENVFNWCLSDLIMFATFWKVDSKWCINWIETQIQLAFCGRLVGGSDSKLIYRHYATLYFVFAVDSSESELGILDLIQVDTHFQLKVLLLSFWRRYLLSRLIRDLRMFASWTSFSTLTK